MTHPTEHSQSSEALVALVQKEKKPRGIRIDVEISKTRTIAVYAGKTIADALSSVTHDMTVWKGVKLIQVLEAVYDQGKKDGARFVFDQIDVLKTKISHRNPGQPKKHRKK